jgi:hypothetical protein
MLLYSVLVFVGGGLAKRWGEDGYVWNGEEGKGKRGGDAFVTRISIGLL